MSKRIGSWLIGIWALTFFHSHASDASIIYNSDPFSPVDAQGLSPFWNWKSIETENFRLYFPQELKEAANQAANYFEEAHRFLSPVFRWQPHAKTQVLLINNLDSENGLTSPFARFGIVLWVTPPDYSYGSHYYDDWLRLLVIHEYTHFLNMDTTVGFWDGLRYVFGDFLLPNALWPPWMLEGLAVYMETRFTTAGRGRSPYYEMVLRAAVEDRVLNTPEFITLDKVNGTNPYFPGGDTRYLFGYNLMNQVAQNPSTLDPNSNSTHNENVLGLMSKRSAGRIPYLINGNLEDITGKNWYDYWDEWVQQTKIRISLELEKVHQQPLTSYTLLTEKNHEVSNDILGMGASPDGKWVAYTLESSNKRQGLYLRNLETGQTKWLLDKLFGIGIRFTPDSRTILYSRLHQIGQYYTYSDLEAYDTQTGATYWLSNNQRLRDPDISKDGKWLTFTLSEGDSTGLAIAPLDLVNGKYQLGAIDRLLIPAHYDRVGNPQFSSDGTRIYFSYHPMGKAQEDLMEFDLATRKITALVTNGKFNRFPAVNGEGELYYVSDLTGIDNLYRYDRKTGHSYLTTNMTTGINFPSFGPRRGKNYPLYAGVFSYTGWNLAEIYLAEKPLDPEAIKIAHPPAPEPGANSVPEKNTLQYKEEDYSIFPSIYPRLWSPLLGIDSTGVIAGAEIFGFDAINVHRYLIAGAYDSAFNLFDWYAVYSDRTLGPAIDFSASYLTNQVQTFSNASIYSRDLALSASAAYPILWTYSALTPQIEVSTERVNRYITGSDFTRSTPFYLTSFIPSISASLTYSNSETSKLSITNESGNLAQVGSKLYLNGDEQIWKGFLSEQQFLRIANHTTLTPSFKSLFVSRLSSSYPSSSAFLQGRTLSNLVNPMPGDGFGQLSIRGYPNILSAPSKAVGVAALDLAVPFFRIFRGAGTNPFFLDNLYGIAFAEASYFPYQSSGYALPSAGGGLRLTAEFFQVPLTFSAEFHKGFREALGGKNDLFFQVLSPTISF